MDSVPVASRWLIWTTGCQGTTLMLWGQQSDWSVPRIHRGWQTDLRFQTALYFQDFQDFQDPLDSVVPPGIGSLGRRTEKNLSTSICILICHSFHWLIDEKIMASNCWRHQFLLATAALSSDHQELRWKMEPGRGHEIGHCQFLLPSGLSEKNSSTNKENMGCHPCTIKKLPHTGVLLGVYIPAQISHWWLYTSLIILISIQCRLLVLFHPMNTGSLYPAWTSQSAKWVLRQFSSAKSHIKVSSDKLI